MDYKDFNAKYKEYLEEGHYGLSFDIPAITEYLDREFEELTKLPGFSYCQIKLKFGHPCVYTKINGELQTNNRIVEEVTKLLAE